jgi:hypothetical protein
MGIDLVEKKSSDALVRATATVEMPLGTFFFFLQEGSFSPISIQATTGVGRLQVARKKKRRQIILRKLLRCF